MSIEQLQKANTLSKELKNFGFADNSEQAYEMAEKALSQGTRSGGESEPVASSEILKKMTELERTKVQVNKKLSDFSEQLASVREQVEEVVKAVKLVEMNQISFDKRLGEFSRPNDAVQLSTPRIAPVAAVPERPVSNPALDKPIDRNGVAPADVHIDKIFYAGKR